MYVVVARAVQMGQQERESVCESVRGRDRDEK